MHGIDIVDLNDPKLKERDERSLKLILHEADNLIEHPAIFWVLWSAKEAVFKCNREAINFSPTSIQINLKVSDNQITFTSGSYSGIVLSTEDYILSVCSDQLSEVHHQVISTNELMDGSKLRDEVLAFFTKQHLDFEMGADDLNLPILLPAKEPISISHHGKWGAFIFPTSLMH